MPRKFMTCVGAPAGQVAGSQRGIRRAERARLHDSVEREKRKEKRK